MSDMDHKKINVGLMGGSGASTSKQTLAMICAMNAVMPLSVPPVRSSGCIYSLNGKCTKKMGLCDSLKECRKKKRR